VIKLIIFDLDGVLVDACEWHRLSLNAALKDIADYEISIDDHYASFDGLPTRVKLKKLTDLGILKENFHEKIYNLKQEKTIAIIEKHACLREEKINLIDELKNKGYIVACFTNSIRVTAKLMLEKTGIYKKLDMIVTNQDVSKAKPDPEGYLAILKNFNLKPEQGIIIEDSPKGIAAGEAAGCKVLKVKNPDEVNFKNISKFLENIKKDKL